MELGKQEDDSRVSLGKLDGMRIRSSCAPFPMAMDSLSSRNLLTHSPVCRSHSLLYLFLLLSLILPLIELTKVT